MAGLATLLFTPAGILAAWRLAFGRPFPGRWLIEAFMTLPLALPPTVAGFGLLLLFGRGTAAGRFLNDRLGVHLVFTWQGAAVASAIMAFPLFARAAAAAFARTDRELLEAGRTLGASEGQLLWHIVLPLSLPGLAAGFTLALARALGEFGATLMVAGSIPGRTQTLSLALYDYWQSGSNKEALQCALMLGGMALLLVGAGALLQRKRE